MYFGIKYVENTLPEVLPTDEEIKTTKDAIRAYAIKVCDSNDLIQTGASLFFYRIGNLVPIRKKRLI